MRILSIETSCDETGAAVVEKKDSEQFVRVLSNVTATSVALHAKTGGIIPEFAAREQIKAIIPVIVRALLESEKTRFNLNQPQRRLNLNEKKVEQANFILRKNIDAIAVTHGPGLIGSLLVGVETAKTLSFAFDKPLIPVHHLLAHLFANFIGEISNFQFPVSNSTFPFIGLIVSGGHTDLLLFESVSEFKWLGGTRDDAAGEALDKIGRLLGLPYPAGAEIERRANMVRKSSINFKSPLLNTEDFDFSFSGLKTEISRFIAKKHLTERLINEICYAIQEAIFAVLIKKTIRAAKLYKINKLALGGGVSANNSLRELFKLKIKNEKLKIKVFAPQKNYSTDNAAMIGSYALLNYKPVLWKKITAEPDPYFDWLLAKFV
ncbi:MAG: tRNA (adenosine(37)-N6)-threonylcarbamoyltransferase complex transferase subunit TsaD [Candidatus Levybacteria bacterium]|nr:tRNA (adenosine(37)-N6)-threonylcarbamoyltransferase complex transferase subunit TsaD [Candidatus Levybacteria bacterium]